MKRKNKLLLNSAVSLLYQITMIVCGFVLPRFFLTYYGSEVNGLVSSITQFLGFISLAECGVGAVVQSALYKPLADRDMESVSKIVLSSECFFRKIAYILLGYVVVLMAVYPLITVDSFDYIYTLVLIFIISISSFAQYYIGMTYKLLLNADQLGFIQYIIHTLALIINTLSCIALIKCGASVHVVKLTTTLIFVIQPILLAIIARRKYRIDRSIKLIDEPIKQKWNAVTHHLSGVVLENTDVVVLTLFSTLENVSVYAVYHLVINGVKQIIVSMTNGVRAMFGNMLARNETEELNRSFDLIEWILHTMVTFVFSVTAILILSFVKVYTADITDANYFVPAFAYLITLAQAVYCYRLPYYILVNAAGHYKQTQWSAIIEAAINVAVSILFVFYFGLVGVAIGTLAAMIYRTVYLAIYLKKNILYRKLRHFIKHIMIDACSASLLFMIVSLIPSFYEMRQINYFAWFILAVKVSLTAVFVLLLINGIFYGGKIKNFLLLRKKSNIK